MCIRDRFSQEDAAEIRYLMNRARRTGLASQQLEVKTGARTLHLAVTVAAIDPSRNLRGPSSGFVVVIEDTSDLLRAQKLSLIHISINGLRSAGTNVMLDGVANNDECTESSGICWPVSAVNSSLLATPSSMTLVPAERSPLICLLYTSRCV